MQLQENRDCIQADTSHLLQWFWVIFLNCLLKVTIRDEYF